MAELIYPKLSYEIIGTIFEVYNQLKYGHQERVYQRAFAEELSKKKIPFKRELYHPILYNEKKIGRYYLDFLIDDKIVVELKVANDFYQKDINQIISYLKAESHRLGILILFTKEGIKYRRILN